MWLVGASVFALAQALYAETPETRPAKNPASRNRSQVIYHVKPASNYAATLHSQEKSQSNETPADGAPTSPERSREHVNVAPVPPESHARSEAPEKQHQNSRPKVQKKQMSRPPMSVKSKGHGNKGHKH
jgi:hypothetical protein